MSEQHAYDYPRVRIGGTLTTLSPLHCGDGDTLPGGGWPVGGKHQEDSGLINTVFRDADGHACIPAPSLRGNLRQRGDDAADLFGEAHGDQGRMGKLRLYDARWLRGPTANGDRLLDEDRGTSLATGVALDPITGTAADRRLYTHEVVPEGTVFQLSLEADRVTEAELQTILALLAGWNGSMVAAIGRGRGHGWGRLQWRPDATMAVLDKQALRQWMAADDPQPPFEQRPLPTVTAATTDAELQLGFTLRPQGPLLINQPGRVQDSGKQAPALEFSRTAAGEARVPGSSLRGALRARAQRILATIIHQRHSVDAEQAWLAVDDLTKQLFGSTDRAGRLWCADPVATQSREHIQTLVAVDRFTCGVKDGALYTVRAADCERLDGHAGLSALPPPPGDAWKALLLLLARDLLEGELNLGWGRSRGFGQCRIEFDWQGRRITDFATLLAVLPSDAPEQWLQALEQDMTTVAAALDREAHT